MLLRPKPSGRGRSLYGEMMPDRQKSPLPLLLELEDKHHLPFHLDCALAPILMRAGASADSLGFLGAYGCIAE
ncbi:MAG: hypothetical protein IMW97_02120 [Firmicutes bacterium]|nr:hypothetical protein [Candidatus Fermentithermobacillaceae bacterium]